MISRLSVSEDVEGKGGKKSNEKETTKIINSILGRSEGRGG